MLVKRFASDASLPCPVAAFCLCTSIVLASSEELPFIKTATSASAASAASARAKLLLPVLDPMPFLLEEEEGGEEEGSSGIAVANAILKTSLRAPLRDLERKTSKFDRCVTSNHKVTASCSFPLHFAQAAGSQVLDCDLPT